MFSKKRIQGFLHYRSDLGDGVRTGVVFSDCMEFCSDICASFHFIPEHNFCEDTAEQKEYTAEELTCYLMEEKTLYYAKKLGITFLGKEPLRDPFFCVDVARRLKKAEISLQIYTCGMCSLSAFEMMDGLVDLYVLRVFLPFSGEVLPGNFHQGRQIRKIIDFLESRETPFRILLPVLPSTSFADGEEFADYISDKSGLKSVMVDFSASNMSDEEKIDFKKIFLSRRIPLY